MRVKTCWLLGIVAFLPLLALSQKSDDAAVKEREARYETLINATLSDIPNLKLPENRALFYSQAGNVLWARDQKRARELFNNAGAELIAAQSQAEQRSKPGDYSEASNGGPLRQQVLNTIAGHDAAMALDLMVKTRPALIQKAMNYANAGEKARKIGEGYPNYMYLVQNETYMEQNFYRLAAEQSPDQAVRLLKESLAKGIGNETYSQLSRLAEKDPKAAAEMTSEIVSKLLSGGFSLDGQPIYPNISLAQALLNEFAAQIHDCRSTKDACREASLKFKLEPGQMQQLAISLLNAFVQDQLVAGQLGASILQIAQRFAPASVDAIKRSNPSLFAQSTQPTTTSDALYQKLMRDDTPIDEVLSQADKLPLSYRRNAYEAASRRLSAQGNIQAARTILEENFGERVRDELLSNFDMQQHYALVGQGKYAEAERLIDRLPENQRVQALVNLAVSAARSSEGQNGRVYANAFIQKAHSMSNDRPENSDEMGRLMQVISGYAVVEPTEAMRLYEGLVPRMNELTDAMAVLNGFQPNSNVRDGEFIMMNTPMNSFGANPNMLPEFAKADMDRTLKLIDSFSRPEVRISLRLQIAGDGTIASLPLPGRGFSRGIGLGGPIVVD